MTALRDTPLPHSCPQPPADPDGIAEDFLIFCHGKPKAITRKKTCPQHQKYPGVVQRPCVILCPSLAGAASARPRARPVFARRPPGVLRTPGIGPRPWTGETEA